MQREKQKSRALLERVKEDQIEICYYKVLDELNETHHHTACRSVVCFLWKTSF